MSRTEPCGEVTRPTPAFDEIIGIVAPEFPERQPEFLALTGLLEDAFNV
jgi:hypothetical protein